MSIAILNQVHDEVRRLAIAGSNLASGDFRLKKLVGPLQQAGEKAPVFAKVAQAVDQLVNSSTENSAEALLELSTLVGAIRYTQGETGAAGPLKPIEGQEFPLPTTAASARVLKPLIEALTTTGSGREEIIKDAHQRGAFNDLRLILPALKAIDDPYAPIGDFVVENVLSVYGKAILPQVRACYDPKGRSGDARRLKLMHRLDPAAAKELIDEALDSGSKDVKLAALGCLKGAKEALPLLLEQAKSKNKEVRAAALASLAEFDEDEAVGALIAALRSDDISMLAYQVAGNTSAKLMDFTLQEARALMNDSLATNDKALRSKKLSRLNELLGCFTGRDDEAILALVADFFSRREDLAKLTGGEMDGQAVNFKVASLMANGSLSTQEQLLAAAQTLQPMSLQMAFSASFYCESATKAYDRFSSFLLAKVKSKKDPAGEKRESIHNALLEKQRQCLRETGRMLSDAQLDPRWLEAAIKTEDTELVMTFARPNHKPTQKFLSRCLNEHLKKPAVDMELWHLMEAMIRIEHPERVEHFMGALMKLAKSAAARYGIYYLVRLIPQLPQEAAPKIEELLPSFPEKIVNEIIPYLAELKSKN